MWLITNIGFHSVVQKPGSDPFTVRARVKEALDALRTQYLPTLSATPSQGRTDYPWRATASHAEFAAVLGRIAQDIDSPHFRNEVATRQGPARAHRHYRAFRKSGTPADWGWETQAVHLVPWARLVTGVANRYDRALLAAINTVKQGRQ